MIEWNDGLNLGVETLDEDHKKLLQIINNISVAINNNESKKVIENIFHDLKEHTYEHFIQEEEYLEKYQCTKLKEHIEQHRVFTQKIPELEAKLLSSKDYTSAQEVTIYLTDWLLNHIIEEDIPAVTIFKKCGLTEKEKQDRSLLARLIKRTTDKFSFTKRIFLSAMVPLSGMLLFGSIIILENFENYLDMKDISAVTHITSDINELVHHLQIERGLSSGYLISKKINLKIFLKNKER